MDNYQLTIFYRTYARWIEQANRRETFEEAVNRYHSFFTKLIERKAPTAKAADSLCSELDDAIESFKRLDAVPSMRAFWTAGEALAQENACAYNCAYSVIELYGTKDLAEYLYLLLCGAGVSNSTERQVVNRLQAVPQKITEVDYTIVFEDSKLGWAQGYHEYLNFLFMGLLPKYDVSKIRPEGSPLKTFGGRASGPEPLILLLKETLRIFRESAGRKLHSDELCDIICIIASVVVVGGARRSATLSLTNPSDRRMAEYKVGNWYDFHKYRGMANISSCYTEKPEPIAFMEDFISLMRSRSGERGFVNREALIKKAAEVGRYVGDECGVNPCGEIILRPKQFCNLSEAVIRADDTYDVIRYKVWSAVVFGFLQSLLTDFNFLDETWKENAIHDRILGVSLTGARDNRLIGTVSPQARSALQNLKAFARQLEARLAGLMGIPPAKAVTCVKPSGTVSQLVNCASGLHVRYAPFYIRRIRIAATDPLASLLRAQGVPHSPENGENEANVKTWVFSFPQKAPKGAITKHDVTAIEQLEYWKQMAECWCDHNASCTVYIKEHEWVSAAGWVYDNFDILSGVTFLPDDNSYQQAPYEEITEEEYNKLCREMPTLDFSKLPEFETVDCTQGSHELACSGGTCEI